MKTFRKERHKDEIAGRRKRKRWMKRVRKERHNEETGGRRRRKEDG